MKSPNLKLEDKAGMEKIYQRVFGTSSVTNYEMHAWIVRGFIIESKGIDLNQVKVVESIAKEKTHRDEVKWVSKGSEERMNNKYFRKQWEHDSQYRGLGITIGTK